MEQLNYYDGASDNSEILSEQSDINYISDDEIYNDSEDNDFYNHTDTENTSENEEEEEDQNEDIFRNSPKILDKDDGKDIRGIIFEKINDTFSKGMYAGFVVLIMNKNGYVNVTKLCKNIFIEHKKIFNDAKEKEFRHWKLLDNAKELIEAISEPVRNPTNSVIVSITTGTNDLRGTYVHPDLVPHIASWASPTIAIKISKIVNEYFANDERKRQRELLKEKDDKIDQLLRKQKKQTGLIKTQMNKIDTQNGMIKTQSDDIKLLLAENKKLMTNVVNLDKKTTNISTKLDKVVPNRVIPTKNIKDTMHFILIRNFKFERNACNRGKPKYSILRVQNKSRNCRFNKHKKNYKYAKILLELTGNPNVMNLWHRVKQRLTDDYDQKIEVISGTSFNLLEE